MQIGIVTYKEGRDLYRLVNSCFKGCGYSYDQMNWNRYVQTVADELQGRGEGEA